MKNSILLKQSHTRTCIKYCHIELLPAALCSPRSHKNQTCIFHYYYFFPNLEVKEIYFDTESITVSRVHQEYFKSF